MVTSDEDVCFGCCFIVIFVIGCYGSEDVYLALSTGASRFSKFRF